MVIFYVNLIPIYSAAILQSASEAIKEGSLLKISSSSLFELGKVKPTKSTADHVPTVPVFQEVLDLNFLLSDDPPEDTGIIFSC